jgi:hypothetical protein
MRRSMPRWPLITLQWLPNVRRSLPGHRSKGLGADPVRLTGLRWATNILVKTLTCSSNRDRTR